MAHNYAIAKPMTETKTPQRVAKLIAASGLCSRRDAEAWIADGRVSLDGAVLDTPAVAIDDPKRLTVDGEPLPDPSDVRVFRFYKPTGVLVTDKDPLGRKTVYDMLPSLDAYGDPLPRLMAVGRLDINSEGLLLLTTSAALKKKLEDPASAYPRTYRVRVYGRIRPKALAELADGINIEGVQYGSILAEAEQDKSEGANRWIRFQLTEGKNREIRRVCAHLGLEVSRLIRIGYGDAKSAGLRSGELKEVSKSRLHPMFGVGIERKKTWAKAKPNQKRVGIGAKGGTHKRRASHGGTRSR